jgi:hypothetical protein
LSRILNLGIIAVVLASLATVGAACSSSSTSNEEIVAIRAYADPATQTTMEGLSEDNLAEYTQYGDAQFKAAVTQDLLDQVSKQINDQLGTFTSVTFSRTETQGEYIIVHYQAKYSKGDVGVRMVFDQDHLVAGQFFE